MLAGMDAGTVVGGQVGVWGCSAPQYGRGRGVERRDTHTHTGTYTRMLHLPFSDLPLKKCPIVPLESTAGNPQGHLKPPEHFQNSLLLLGTPLFQRGPPSIGHGFPSGTEGISDVVVSQNM